jgi:hypothetical protein
VYRAIRRAVVTSIISLTAGSKSLVEFWVGSLRQAIAARDQICCCSSPTRAISRSAASKFGSTDLLLREDVSRQMHSRKRIGRGAGKESRGKGQPPRPPHNYNLNARSSLSYYSLGSQDFVPRLARLSKKER